VCREEFRYDAAADYRADDFESVLDATCSEGVEVYFDTGMGERVQSRPGAPVRSALDLGVDGFVA
jgi:NADPH-dependent curcumin reductase CurA